MKKATFILGLFLAFTLTSCGQRVVSDTTAVKVAVMAPGATKSEATGLFYEVGPDSTGKFRHYPIWRGPKGGYYIERVSATGNPYKQYLKPEEMQ